MMFGLRKIFALPKDFLKAKNLLYYIVILEKSFKALILFKLQKSHLLPINKLEAGA